MVAVLLRLKLTLLLNGFRRSAWQTVGFVLSALYGLSIVGMVAVGSIGLSFLPDDERWAWLVVGGSVAVLGWWLIPLLAFGLDATLDPRRFQQYAIERRDLLVGLALAGMVGVAGAATLLSGLSTALAWWDSPLALVAAVVGAVLGVALCAVGSRTITAVMAPLVERRRFREIAVVLVLVPVLMLGPLVGQLFGRLSGVRDWLPDVAGVLAWTPLGAPWSLAGDVAEGRWLSALGRIVVTLVTLALMLLAWGAALDRTMTRPPSHGSAAQAQGYGWLDRLPDTRTGAVAARCLTYWQRDPRYAGSIAFVPFLPVPFIVVGGLEGNDSLLWLAPVIAYVMGFAISADLAYDNTAFWLHVVSGVRGAADRAGRVVAVLTLGLPMVVLLAVGGVWAAGRWDTLVAVLGMSVGVLLIAAGASSVLSAAYLYPVQKPGDGLFSQPQGATTAIFVGQTIGLVVVALLSAPTVVLFVVALATGAVWATALTVVVGLGSGIGVLLLGIRTGGRLVDERGPELLQKMAAWS
ncbi:hypothetical protein KV102_11475 [Mumia sp. zg.B53]|uniref:hypothetical protein n=1 Tax=unclassified Mumia TaxID=2621872 RepID=UPI001C6DE30F|nr:MULTISPECIES: hypothetical protein [unclassified Mumia]MBW9210895.1 hypothetical protein [Mumia sp. zg.B21]MBW9215461.1 hypothetical protein [Mumia sp. zg.B53]